MTAIMVAQSTVVSKLKMKFLYNTTNTYLITHSTMMIWQEKVVGCTSCGGEGEAENKTKKISISQNQLLMY